MADLNPGEKEIQCPHCGHVVVRALRCSQCSMRLQKRAGLNGIKIGVVVAAIGALFLFQNYRKDRDHPNVKIGDISASMNFLTIRVQGVLEVDARKLRNGSVLYVVSDGTGSLPIFSAEYPDGELPRVGRKVSAVGRMNVRAGNELRMQAQQVKFEPEVDEWVAGFSLAEITTEQQDARLTAYGRVSRIWKSPADSKAPNRIVIKDRSGTLEVVHWLKNPPIVALGDVLEITGVVEVYKGRVQLKVRKSGDIRLFEETSDLSIH